MGNWVGDLRIQSAQLAGQNAEFVNLVIARMEKFPNDEKTLEFVRSAARVAHLQLKNYSRAIDLYKFIVMSSPESQERRNAQMYTAQIYFENLHDFEKSVLEYERLLKLDLSPAEKFRFRINVARAHYQMNNHKQALSELRSIFTNDLDEDSKFEVLRLEGSVLMANRQLNDATEVWQEILKRFPDRSAKENVALNLVVCFEESKQFLKAVEVLESMRENYPNKEFLDIRIARLKERHRNLPGAEGWKR